MNGSATTQSAPHLMREEARPAWPDALEAAAQRMIAGSHPAMKPLRAAALEALRKRGLPQSGSEDFTFVRVNEFLPHLSAVPEHASERTGRGLHVPKTATMPTLALIRSLIFPEARDNFLVILDGEFSPALSNPGEGFSIETLEAAVAGAALSPSLVESLSQALSREADASASLAALFAIQPLLIKVVAKTANAAPLGILHLRTNSKPLRRDTFLILAAGRQSESRILVRHTEAHTGEIPVNANGSMSNIRTLLLVDEGASVKWLEASPEGDGNAADIHFHKLGALLERDARLFTATASTGAKLARNAYAVDLRAPGAEVEIHGATVLAGARQSHNFLEVRHLAPHCVSRQHFKTVAADRARSSVDGTVFVAEGAQLTNANQLINNLMLSDEARADSKPRLLIHADDVKCTHGATAGKLDPEQQFYLESRGLPAAQARTLLTLAFIAEVVDRAEAASGAGFRAHLDATLLDTLKRRLSAAPAETGD